MNICPEKGSRCASVFLYGTLAQPCRHTSTSAAVEERRDGAVMAVLYRERQMLYRRGFCMALGGSERYFNERQEQREER